MLRFRRKLPFVHLKNPRSHNLAGEGGDFLELGEYVYGQDARFLAPTACLKYQKPMVRVFQKEALSYLNIFLLPSKSLLLGAPTKLAAITQICEILLQSAHIYGLKPILHYLDAHQAQTLTHLTHIRAMLDSLQSLRFSQRDQLHKATSAEIMRHLIAHKHQKGLGVIIGDFYKLDLRPHITSLKQYLALYALCMRTTLEWEPEFLDSLCAISDVETQAMCEDTITLQRYKERLAHYDARLSAYFARMGAQLAYINPHDPLLPQLQRVFA